MGSRRSSFKSLYGMVRYNIAGRKSSFNTAPTAWVNISLAAEEVESEDLTLRHR